MNNLFNGMFGKVQSGMCRLSMNGDIAVKTSHGYKAYRPKDNRLINCDSFVFDIGDEMFFVIPTNKVEIGDIILANGKPKCVVSVDENTITAINYEDSTVENILPERHIFMGSTYFYGKIVSMFGNALAGKNGGNNLMKYMMFSEMMKGNNGNSSMGNLLPLMMLSGGNGFDFGDMFGGIFQSDDSEKESE